MQPTRSASSPLGVALAFVGLFVVGSLSVPLIASLPGSSGSAGSRGPAPVVAHPSTLWADLGSR